MIDLFIVIAAFLLFVALIAFLVGVSKNRRKDIFIDIEQGQKRYGNIGEKRVTKMIKEVLTDGDYLFTNVEIEVNDQRTELDNVIVNECGIFIIEVKNYKGRLEGTENDKNWIKYHTDDYGITHEKIVRNPIKQVNREVYIFANFLKENDIRIWIEGYVFLLNCKSPVNSEKMLRTRKDIDLAIHTLKGKKLNKKVIEKAVDVISYG